MQRRVFNHSLLAGTALAAGGLLSLPAQAQSGFKEGKDYQRLKQPVAVDAAAGQVVGAVLSGGNVDAAVFSKVLA